MATMRIGYDDVILSGLNDGIHSVSWAPHFTLGVSNNMSTPVSLLDRIRGFFARDKDAFWWNHFTDEEKKLRRMDVRQLAKVINELRVRNLAGESENLIVAEHMLKERIARIQSRPTWFAIWAGLVGIAGGAFLTSSLQPPNETNKCVCECKTAGTLQQPAHEPIKAVPTKPAVGNVIDIPSSSSKKQ